MDSSKKYAYDFPKYIKDILKTTTGNHGHAELTLDNTIYDGKTFLLSVFLHSFPEKLAAMASPWFLEKAKRSDNIAADFTDTLSMCERMSEIEPMIKALEQKLMTKRINPSDFSGIRFEYVDDNLFLGVNQNGEGQNTYGNEVTIESSTATDIEQSYTDKDDIIYDIYMAYEIASFCVKYYFDVVVEQQLNETVKYKDIITLLNTQVVDFSELKRQLIDQRVLIQSYTRNPNLYPYIAQELSHTGNIWRIAIIDNKAEIAKTLENKMKLAVFKAFYTYQIKETIVNEQLSEQDQDRVESEFGALMSILYSPEIQHDEELVERINKVYELYEMKALSYALYADQDLSAKIEFYDSIKHKFECPIKLDTKSKGLNLKKINLRKIMIRRNGISNLDFAYLVPSSTDTRIKIDGRIFPSIRHYAVYKLYINFLGFDESKAYSLLEKSRNIFLDSKTLEETYEYMKALTINEMLANSVNIAVNKWLLEHRYILNATGRKYIVFNCENTFLGENSNGEGSNYVGKFLMYLRQKGNMILSNNVLLKWSNNMVKDMNLALEHVPMRNRMGLLERLYGFPVLRKSNVEIKFEGKKHDIVEDYISKFISYAFSHGMSTEELESYVIQKTAYTGQQVTKDQLKNAFDNIRKALSDSGVVSKLDIMKASRSIILNENVRDFKQMTPDEFWVMLSSTPEKYIPRVLYFEHAPVPLEINDDFFAMPSPKCRPVVDTSAVSPSILAMYPHQSPSYHGSPVYAHGSPVYDPESPHGSEKFFDDQEDDVLSPSGSDQFFGDQYDDIVSPSGSVQGDLVYPGLRSPYSLSP